MASLGDSLYRYKKIKLPDGSTIDEHRLVWEQAYGPIPEGGVIHHKNGDGRDNRLSNLELTTRKEHLTFHPEVLEAMHLGQLVSQTRARPEGFVWCNVCQQFLPEKEFGPDKTTKSGFTRRCYSCRKLKGWGHNSRKKKYAGA